MRWTVQETLNAMSKRGEWDQMADAITDEMLTAFAVEGAPADVGSQIVSRYGDVADRISLYTLPEGHEADILDPIVAAVHDGGSWPDRAGIVRRRQHVDRQVRWSLRQIREGSSPGNPPNVSASPRSVQRSAGESASVTGWNLRGGGV